MKEVEYVVPLGFDGRRRTLYARDRNEILEFVVQYELRIRDAWRPVIRYDTAHGFAHKDILSFKDETVKQKLSFSDYNLALTFAEKDLRDNWRKYRENFLREASKND